MADMTQFEAQLAGINEATNILADEIAALRALVEEGGLSEAQEQSVLDQLAQIEARLRAIAAPPEPPA